MPRLIFLVITAILFGCVGGNSEVGGDSTTGNSQLKAGIPSSYITEADPINAVSSTACFNSDNMLKLCSGDNAVCAKITACPTAGYAPGGDMSGANYWVQKEFAATSGIFKLTFNSNVAADFHLSGIYNDLDGNTAVGKIEQIDTSECDSLIAGGKTAGQSCNIDFVYAGLSTNQKTNNIHLLFTSQIKPQQNLDVNILVNNQMMTLQNTPIMNTIDDSSDYSLNINSIDDNGTNLYYPNQYTEVLVNNGAATMTQQSGQANILVSIGSKFKTTTSLTIPNAAAITSCDYASVVTGGVCLFTFNNIQDFVSTQYARMLYSYMSSSGNKTQYSMPVIIGSGDIISRDYSFTPESPVLELNKLNYHSDYINYSLPLNNFTLSAELDTSLNIPSKESDGHLFYAVGDYNKTRFSQYVKTIKFEYDPGCFDDTNLSIDQNNSDPYSVCKIRVVLPTTPALSNQFMAFQLYATYDSPSGDKVRQFIGNVSIGTQSYPNGNYLTVFNKISFKNGILQATDKNTAGAKPSQLAYASNCEFGSNVDYFTTKDYKRTIDSVRQLDYYEPVYPSFLMCKHLSANLPHGDYYKSCADISYSNGILNASCRYDYKKQYGKDTYNVSALNTTSLDYTQCGQDSTVTNDNGKLVCQSAGKLAIDSALATVEQGESVVTTISLVSSSNITQPITVDIAGDGGISIYPKTCSLSSSSSSCQVLIIGNQAGNSTLTVSAAGYQSTSSNIIVTEPQVRAGVLDIKVPSTSLSPGASAKGVISLASSKIVTSPVEVHISSKLMTVTPSVCMLTSAQNSCEVLIKAGYAQGTGSLTVEANDYASVTDAIWVTNIY